LKLRGERYVLLKEKDFNAMKSKPKSSKPTPSRKASRKVPRLTAQDRGDIAEAVRRIKNSDDLEVPYEETRRRLASRQP